jgi:hypothetical protein
MMSMINQSEISLSLLQSAAKTVVAGISIPSADSGNEVFGLVRYTPTGTVIGTTAATFVTNGLNVPSAGRRTVQWRHRGGWNGIDWL